MLRTLLLSLLALTMAACSSGKDHYNFLKPETVSPDAKFWINDFDFNLKPTHADFSPESELKATYFDGARERLEELGKLAPSKESADYWMNVTYNYNRNFGSFLAKNTLNTVSYNYTVDVVKEGEIVATFSDSRDQLKPSGIMNIGNNMATALTGLTGNANPDIEKTYAEHLPKWLGEDIAGLKSPEKKPTDQ